MDRKGQISEYRSKLDKTLASSDLTNDEMVHTLVKNQILQSVNYQSGEYNDYVVERRSKEVSNFLSELRSASVDDERLKSGDESHGGWKVKQDTHELRVMYREGPKGTPFHTLLCEGYVDGTIDVCMCISCESDLYTKWWPQIMIPTFKVTTSHCVQKIRLGEQISVVRMKLSWPLSSREALLHYFVFEYFQDGLVVVVLKSISDSENIDRSTHGFTRDGIPDAQDVVRMDVFGGFALQKVTEDRSYFRTIANMDIKLDFVPPAFINFIARQLVGSGFKLYKKEIASVSEGDGKFREALKEPLYTRIHEALYSQHASMDSRALDNTRNTSIVFEEQSTEALKLSISEEKTVGDDFNTDSEPMDAGPLDIKLLSEIEEFEEKYSDRDESLGEGAEKFCDEITDEVRTSKMEVGNGIVAERGYEIKQHFGYGYDIETKIGIRPHIQRALDQLEKAISLFREYNNSTAKGQYESVKIEQLLNLVNDACEDSSPPETDEMRKKDGTCNASSKIESADSTSHASRNSSDNHGSRHRGSNSYARETNQSKIAPASPDKGLSSPSHVKVVDLHSSVNQRNASTAAGNKIESSLPNGDANINSRNMGTQRKIKKPKFCCLSSSS